MPVRRSPHAQCSSSAAVPIANLPGFGNVVGLICGKSNGRTTSPQDQPHLRPNAHSATRGERASGRGKALSGRSAARPSAAPAGPARPAGTRCRRAKSSSSRAARASTWGRRRSTRGCPGKGRPQRYSSVRRQGAGLSPSLAPRARCPTRSASSRSASSSAPRRASASSSAAATCARSRDVNARFAWYRVQCSGDFSASSTFGSGASARLSGRKGGADDDSRQIRPWALSRVGSR